MYQALSWRQASTHFPCCTSTKVQTLTPDERAALRDGGRLQVYVEAVGEGGQVLTGAYQAAAATFGPKFQNKAGESTGGVPGEISLESYLGNACALDNSTSLTNKRVIAVVVRGVCTFVDKVRQAQESRALADVC